MRMVKCPNGHFYDPSRYSSCPFCMQKKDAQYTKESAVHVQPGMFPPEANHIPAGAYPYANVNANANANVNIRRDDQATVAYGAGSFRNNPPCGFLICYAGPHIGTYHPIHFERNTIGRSMEMDIPLMDDLGISRNKHAILSFDPKSQHFTLIPDPEKSIIYVNGEECVSPIQLKAYDRIEVSETGLIFLPLCGEQFSWEGIMKE